MSHHMIRIPEDLISDSEISRALLDIAGALRRIQSGRMRVAALLGRAQNNELDDLAYTIYRLVEITPNTYDQEPF